jgi:hypothetical protein
MGSSGGDGRRYLAASSGKFRASRPLWPLADQIQLHHADVAAFTKLQIRDFEHGRSLTCARDITRPLHENLLGIRIQNNGGNLKRRRKLDRTNLTRDCHEDSSVPLL